jgi:2-oxoglutarate ferredoxin oxidoreductase subunit delta
MPTEPSKKRKISKFICEIVIDKERCKGCGFCVEFCPTDVLDLDEGFNAKGYHAPVVDDIDYCTGCDLCGMYCPDFAIYALKVGRRDKKEAV